MGQDCTNKDRNLEVCGCTYEACTRRGKCCECIQHHLKNKQLPGCCFPPEVEASFDRSFKAFAKAWGL